MSVLQWRHLWGCMFQYSSAYSQVRKAWWLEVRGRTRVAGVVTLSVGSFRQHSESQSGTIVTASDGEQGNLYSKLHSATWSSLASGPQGAQRCIDSSFAQKRSYQNRFRKEHSKVGETCKQDKQRRASSCSRVQIQHCRKAEQNIWLTFCQSAPLRPWSHTLNNLLPVLF